VALVTSRIIPTPPPKGILHPPKIDNLPHDNQGAAKSDRLLVVNDCPVTIVAGIEDRP
jgi:hypothetical protein